MSVGQFFAFIAVVAVVGVNSQTDEWDPTIRDKTEFCSTMAQYAPTGDIYCQQFELCCTSQFDPNNGDKCQVKEAECQPNDDGNSGTGTCKFTNCTELITTTTTTTTPAPVYDEVNSGFRVLQLTSPLFVILAALFFCC